MQDTINGTDMLITAAEGGINYWARITKYVCDYAQPADTDHVGIEDEEGNTFTIYATDMIKAAKLVTEMYPDIRATRYIKNDCFDAEAADVVFQVACYGKIVYG